MIRLLHRPRWPATWKRRIFAAVLVFALVYSVLSYAVLPTFWSHYEGHERLAKLTFITTTSLGIPGDPLNIALEGSESEVLCALNRAGWIPADARTFRSSLKIVGSVLFDTPYLQAPVSDLFYGGERQDFAFQKAAGRSASSRHHVRFWRSLEGDEAGRPLWLGSVTYDRSVGFSHYTGAITHHIGADVDAERDALTQDLVAAGQAQAVAKVSGVRPTLFARNGGGDFYFTDGEMSVVTLTKDCKPAPPPPAPPAPPPRIGLKDQLFAAFGALWRWL